MALWFKKKDIKDLEIDHPLQSKEKSPDDEFHVTMMYLGDLKDISQHKADIEKTLKEIASNQKPFEIEIGGITQFFSEKDKKPLVFSINSRAIEPLRFELLETMKNIGIEEPESSPPFTPHMTVGFSEKDKLKFNDFSTQEDSLKVESIHLSWGGDLKEFKFKS